MRFLPYRTRLSAKSRIFCRSASCEGLVDLYWNMLRGVPVTAQPRRSLTV